MSGIRDTLERIESRISENQSLNPDQKAELQRLLATLKSEIGEVAESHADQAHSIAGFTQLSTHEAMREQRDPHLLKVSLEGLSSSVQGFESSHPRLVQIVNSIATTLSNMGI
jgi:hypothetical protein